MDVKSLHEKFKDEHSPSPEAQIRWLQKQGFPQHQIDQAFILLYQDIEVGRLPKVFELWEGDKIKETRYGPHDLDPPGPNWVTREMKNGWDLDQCLLECARITRTNELSSVLKNIEVFELKLRKKWMSQVPWYKRIFGKKPEA